MRRYLIALGSNRRHPVIGRPRAVIAAALAELERRGAVLAGVSPIIASRPLGPSAREFANAAALLDLPLAPPAMLALLQAVERSFGRRRRGARWGARVLDLDIVLWSGGCWSGPSLTIPHPEFRARRFVLGPAAAIAPDWREPVSGRTLRQLNARLTRPHPLPR